MIKIGSALAEGIPNGLVRDLAPMARAIRATMPALARRALEGDSGDALRRLEAALQLQWSNARISRLVEKRGAQVVAASDRDWAPLRRAISRDSARVDQELPDGLALLQRWVADAASEITSVRSSVIPGLQRDILHAVEHGWSPEQLATAWRKRNIPLLWGTLEGRTKAIAHNQLRALQSKVQRERARAVGVREFDWRTKGDSRVRPEHQRLEGTRHEYDDPPSEGLPGEPHGCRCWAESVVTAEVLGNLGIGAVIGGRAA